MKHSSSMVVIGFFLSIILISSGIQAQLTHFTSFTSNTGNNLTVVVPTSSFPTIDGSPITVDDEIGVFTPADLCVGAAVWTGSNIAITVWGDDNQTTPVDGMADGEVLSYKIWDESEDIEYDAAVTYRPEDDGLYDADAIFVLTGLDGMIPPVVTVSPASQDKYVGEDASFSTTIVSGTEPITYQWKLDGVELSGKTGAILLLSPVALADDGDYTCVATNGVGSDESDVAATLNVLTPTITITSPNGGETVYVGSTVDIAWTSVGTPGNVKIEYTSNGTVWHEIVGSVANSSPYSWTVPDDPSSNCRVRISDEFDGYPSDVSPAEFEIRAPSITVIYPNGGETLLIGSTVDITWSSAGVPVDGDIKIEYSTDGGSSYLETITGSTPNTGSYSWNNVPAVVSSLCRIKISELDNDPFDESNTNFTIAYQQQTISLSGWDMISFNVDPLVDNVETIFSGISTLVLVKDIAGKVHMPEFTINDIGDITITDGYKVYTSAGPAEDLTVSGIAVDISTTDVPLSVGWNMIAYLPQSSMLIVDALTTITDDITLVKNNDGQTYVPTPYFNNIVNMVPGDGYKIHIKDPSPGSFKYPSSFRTSAAATKKVTSERPQLSHFTFTGRTGNNMTVIITSAINPLLAGTVIETGDEIGVFTSEDICVGGAAWTGKNIAVTVWGDNEMTSIVDGITSGEVLQFRLFDVSAGKEFTAEAGFTSGGPEYLVDGIAVLSDLISVDPVDIQLDDPVMETRGIQFFVAPSFVSQTGEPVALMAASKTGLTDIRFTIYDPLGNVVHTGSLESAQPDSRGEMILGTWAGVSTNGRKVATGTYLVVVTLNGPDGSRKCFRSFVGVKE